MLSSKSRVVTDFVIGLHGSGRGEVRTAKLAVVNEGGLINVVTGDQNCHGFLETHEICVERFIVSEVCYHKAVEPECETEFSKHPKK